MSPDTLTTSTGGAINYSDIFAQLVGLGGVVVAGISVYFSYKWRTATIRDKLYEKQIEVISKIMPVVSDFLFLATGLDKCKDIDEVIERRDIINSSKEHSIKILQNAYFEAEPFLPRKILKMLYTYIREITVMINPADPKQELPKEKQCVDYYWDLVNAIRREYRIEELTKEYQKLLPK